MRRPACPARPRALGSVGPDEGPPQLHRPPVAAPGAGGARGAGHEPALVVGRADPRPVPVGRPRRVGRHRSTIRCGCSGVVPRERLDALVDDPGFMRFLGEVRDELQRYLDGDRWFQAREATRPLRSVAYFSPEFGIAEALPQYSGGLGVLAGDHLKACSDLGVPLVGDRPLLPPRLLPPVAVDRRLAAGALPRPRPARHGAHAVRRRHASRSTSPARRSSPGCGGPTSAGCRCTCSTPTSRRTPPDLRAITDRLYGGDTEHRLRQEILLGIGGVRALDALGIDAQVFHTNEGHAGFLGLERIRQLVKDPGLSLPRGHRGGAGRRASSPPTRRCRPASTASPAS